MLHRNGTPPRPRATFQNDTGKTGTDKTGADKAGPAPVARRTQFLPDLPADSPRAQIYHLGRQRVAGLPALRWLYVLLGIGALFTLLLPMPWSWLAALVPLLIIALWLWQWTVRRDDFVTFTPGPAPAVVPMPLPPDAKLPVYVSGLLAVENKVRRFAGLPGFYRTFATREHALLCQVRPRRLAGLAAWPEDEVGLWYAFFAAPRLHALYPGTITFGRRSLPGFAIDYTPAQPLGGKKKRQPQRLTLYVAFPEQADLEAALADLAVEPLPISPAQPNKQNSGT